MKKFFFAILVLLLMAATCHSAIYQNYFTTNAAPSAGGATNGIQISGGVGTNNILYDVTLVNSTLAGNSTALTNNDSRYIFLRGGATFGTQIVITSGLPSIVFSNVSAQAGIFMAGGEIYVSDDFKALTNISSANGVFYGNGSGLTNVADVVGGLDNRVASIVATNPPGFFGQASSMLKSWTMIGTIVTTNTAGIDAGGLRVSSVIFDKNLIRVYYAGYTNFIHAGSPANNGGHIVMAVGTSWDTLTFKTNVLWPTAGQWDGGNIGGCRVFRFDDSGTNYMYYFAGTNTTWEQGKQEIGVAYSTDGTNWTKYSGNPILTTGAAASWDAFAIQGGVHVMKANGQYYMYFGGMDVDHGDESVGLATATSPLGPWTKHSGNPVVNLAAGIAVEPNVFPLPGQGWGMLCGFASSVSTDLTNWSTPTIVSNLDPLRLKNANNVIASPFVFYDQGLCALYDDSTAIFLARPTAAPPLGLYFGSGAGLTNVNADTLGNAYNVDGSGSFYEIWEAIGGPGTGMGFDEDTNSWAFLSPVRFNQKIYLSSGVTGDGSGLTNLNANNIASGTVPTARLGSGTANSSSFLRGDQTWAAVSGSLPADPSVNSVLTNKSGGPAGWFPIASLPAGSGGTNLWMQKDGSNWTNALNANIIWSSAGPTSQQLTLGTDDYINNGAQRWRASPGLEVGTGTYAIQGTGTSGGLSEGDGSMRVWHTVSNYVSGGISAGSLTAMNYLFVTNGNNTGTITVGQVLYTNITGNVTLGGFSGITTGYNQWAKVIATNSTATDYKITLAASITTSTNAFVVGQDIWVTNKSKVHLMFDIGPDTNCAAIRFQR